MTSMSKAAIAPCQPHISEAARQHPLFPAYQTYRSAMNMLLVKASSFEDWLYQREHVKLGKELEQHPQFKAFQAWMRENKGGARPCPAGSFPQNFYYWLDRGRW